MGRLLALGGAVSLAVISVANAQPPGGDVPDELRAAGQAAVDYTNAIPRLRMSVAYDPSSKLNNSSAQLREWINQDRAELAKAGETLATLKIPTSNSKDFDVSFALRRMRDDAKTRFTAASEELDALDAMISAQKAGDCVAYAAHGQAMGEANRKLRSSTTSDDARTVQTFLSRFAGAEPPEPLMQVALAPAPAAYLLKQLANDLATPLRCPLPDFAFDIDVSISSVAGAKAPDNFSVSVNAAPSAGPLSRNAIESRFSKYAVSNKGILASLAKMKQPLKFHWDGYVLAPAAE